ncbi:AAA family ATPase [Xanthomonas hortorum]|uniref:AAA family ATPase n=2 Tax=Xanthomonas hortorum TaxID=56454 RepID=A0A9X4BW90_9XANT|nr:AAA family ATPase [Xanthomonas hortorum pv. hederae]
MELCKFRRLGKVQLKLDQQTTILVGANNSGKTSILTALRHFLSESVAFGAFDISLSQWPALRELGIKWEALTEDPATAAPKLDDDWEGQLATLLSAMPTLDLWFDAEAGMFHYVRPFLSKLVWKGGAVGIRLRLEPAIDVASLQELAWAYNLARQPVKDMSSESQAWPIDLLDYWLREPRKLGQVRPYSLDAANNPIQGIKTYQTQVLAVGAKPADRKHLARLIRVDFVAAQRGLGSEEADSRSTSSSHPVGLFSAQLLKFARQHLNVAVTGHGQRADLIQAVASAQMDLDQKIHDALAASVEEVKLLGYPGIHDPQEIRFRTRIHTADLLDHGTAVQYSMKGGNGEDLLPEFSIGLGYQNLQSLSYQLVSFKTARMNPETGSPPPVHLVMIEEPEAHLHVQVQRIFPDKAHKLISPADKDASSLKSQLLISTHSSHLAHAEDFDRLRYVRRVLPSTSHLTPSTEVVDLGEVFGNDDDTRQFAERYFRVQHTDLLFANAAIFVEGVAERMLVPLFMELKYEKLNSRYVSFLDIGGSHAHRLRPLVEKLQIPTVVITDLDPTEKKAGPKGKMRWMATANTGQGGLRCGNATLREWHPQLQNVDDFKAPTPAQLTWTGTADCKVRFAWQLPVTEADGQWPTTFEDSLILTNIDWFKGLNKLTEEAEAAKASNTEKAANKENIVKPPIGALADAAEAVAGAATTVDLMNDLHALMRDSFSKGDFAASIFERVAAGEDIICPKYIADALAWLQDELDPAAGELP